MDLGVLGRSERQSLFRLWRQDGSGATGSAVHSRCNNPDSAAKIQSESSALIHKIVIAGAVAGHFSYYKWYTNQPVRAINSAGWISMVAFQKLTLMVFHTWRHTSRTWCYAELLAT